MFERNRVDTGTGEDTATAATVTLSDGRQLSGYFFHYAGRSFANVLNGPNPFLRFETYDGERSLLAKSQFVSVAPKVVPAARKLPAASAAGFDPYAILGLKKGAAWDEIRQTYIAKSKAYHPDRYAGVDLPVEVRDYLAATARRINVAYAELEAHMQANKPTAAKNAEPIFTTGPAA